MKYSFFIINYSVIFAHQNFLMMNWTKLIIASVIAGILYFFLGWLVYGILLKDAMTMPEGMKEIVERKPEDMNMTLMLISCLAWGVFISYIYIKMGTSGWMDGAIQGVVISVLLSLSIGANMTAMFTFTNMNNTYIDMLASGVCGGLAGAVIGMYLGRTKTV